MMAQQEQQQGMEQQMPQQGMPAPMEAFMPPPGEPGLFMENNAMMAQFGTELEDFLVKAGEGKELESYQRKGETAREYYKRKNLGYPKNMKDATWNGKAWYLEDGSDPIPKLELRRQAIAAIQNGQIPEEYRITEDVTETVTDTEQEAVTTDKQVEATDKQVETVVKSDGNKNPYAAGSEKAIQYDKYIADGYTPTIVKKDGKNRISFVREAVDGRTMKDATTVQVFDQSKISGSGSLSETYTPEIRTQQELNNDPDVGDIATFIGGKFSGNKLPDVQSVNTDGFGYGSDMFSSKESEEDFYYRNQKVIDELKKDGVDFKFNMKMTDPGYDKNWRSFQNKYEEKRKEYFDKKNVQYIPYFFTKEVLEERLQNDPATYDKDGDGILDKEWKKRLKDGKRGGYTVNAPGFDMDYQARDEQFMDLPDDPEKEKKKEIPLKPEQGPEWWQQDVNNLIALNNIKDNLYLPFAPVLEDQKIDYVLDDYTGRVNSNLAAQNTMAQALGAYGPQAIARSNIQGKTLDANAKAINQVNQNNVRTMNQVATMQPQLDMKVDIANNATNKQLYDDTVTALQNSDNFKNWQTAKTNELYNAGLTNMANTYNMNQLYDYYNVNPSKAGIVEFGPNGKRLMKDSKGNMVDQNIAKWQKLQELVGKDDKGNQREVTETMWEKIYGPNSSSNVQRSNGQQEMINQGAPVGYNAAGNIMTTSKKGKEIKKLPKWAVPFYSGKMGM